MKTNGSTGATVCDYQTGETLAGTPDERLIAESTATPDAEGAEIAWLDGDVWRWCSAQMAATYRAQGRDVRTVYVA